MPPFVPIFSSLNNDNEDENSPLIAHLSLDESIKHELALAPQLPQWVHSTQEATSDLASDCTNQHHNHSQFQRESSLLA